jgi:hypothetical protein
MMGEHDTAPMPPPTFEFLVASLAMQAQMQLGMFHFGKEEDAPEPNLLLARHAIDMLAMLQEKTRGNLSIEEQRELENTLTELRFRYVQAVEEASKAKADAPSVEAPSGGSGEEDASAANS